MKEYISLHIMRYSTIIEIDRTILRRLSLWDAIKENQKQSSIKGLSLDVILSHFSLALEIIIARMPDIEKLVYCAFIKKYGGMQTALFPQDLKSIIKMKILLIMRSKTWNVFLMRNIKNDISCMKIPPEENFYVNMLHLKSKRLPKSGMLQRRAKPGIKNLGAYLGKMLNISLASVSTAVLNLRLLIEAIERNIVLTYAKLRPVVNQGLMMKHDYVRAAGKNFVAIVMSKGHIVPSIATLNGHKKINCSVYLAEQSSLPILKALRNIVQVIVLINTCIINEQVISNLGSTLLHSIPLARQSLTVLSCLDADRYMCAKDIRPTEVHYSSRVY